MDFAAEFERITGEEDRRARIARGEPRPEEMLRFAREEMDSPPAPIGFHVHPSHRPQTEQEAAENPEGGRYCLSCCVLVTAGGKKVTLRGADPCAGKRTMVLGGDDMLHWVSVPGR